MLKISNVETFYGKIQALRGVDLDVNDHGDVLHESLAGNLRGPGDSITVGELIERLQVDFQDHEQIKFMLGNHVLRVEEIEHSGLGEGEVEVHLSMPPKSARRTTRLDP